MISNSTDVRLGDTAQNLFDVMTQFCLVAPRGRRRMGELKEVEFLTLAILHEHNTMIVGDIQRLLGVLPAQMSRIIRALESREMPFITCQINPQDKRKIDVTLTESGERALLDYQEMRTQGIADVLRNMPEDDQDELNRVIEKLRIALEASSLGYWSINRE
jgi:DNA-binding MarR family transcriptional regulator